VGRGTAVFITFLIAAVTIIFVMALLVILIGTAQNHILQPLRASPQRIKRWGGFILIFVGSWLIVLAIWAGAFSRIFSV
jgi:cytochrome c biogenesis protein CcdA